MQDNFNVEDVIDVSSIESVMIGNNEFCNLNVSDNRDNDGSLVLVGDYAGYRVLLMGDASKDIERKIMDNVGDIDIIKIGHHGSNSSSDFDFLKKIKGEIAIISVGENNLYGHPHKEVEDNLYALGYIVFRTDKHNNIGFGKNIFKVSFIDYFK